MVKIEVQDIIDSLAKQIIEKSIELATETSKVKALQAEIDRKDNEIDKLTKDLEEQK